MTLVPAGTALGHGICFSPIFDVALFSVPIFLLSV